MGPWRLAGSAADSGRAARAQDAVRHKRPEAQKALLAAGAVLGESEVMSRLCAVASEGDLEALQTLHRNGADLGASDYLGRTPLHVAACKGCLAVVDWLTTPGRGIEVNALARLRAPAPCAPAAARSCRVHGLGWKRHGLHLPHRPRPQWQVQRGQRRHLRRGAEARYHRHRRGRRFARQQGESRNPNR